MATGRRSRAIDFATPLTDEWVAVGTGTGRPPRARTHRLAYQAAERFPPDCGARGMPDYVFAFRDSDELGPRMLARIAKRTGLQPDDL